MTLDPSNTKINVVVTVRQYNALVDEAQRTGLKISELVRQAITLRLAPASPKPRKQP
jgi:hypothetical protein